MSLRNGTWIYFNAVATDLIPEGWFIKIGKSRTPRGKRLRELRQTNLDGSETELVQLCEVRGVGADEKALHAYFAYLRSHRECFRPDARLVDYVRWLRDQWFVCVPETTDDEREALPMVGAESWMPDGSRERPRDTSLLPGLFGPLDLGPARVDTVDDFYTNQRVIEAARTTMGAIDLDPASHAQANTVVKAAAFFTASTNGLAQRWHGRVWLNPPFSAWSEWATKIGNEMVRGRIDQLCTMAATRTITAQYFHPLLQGCAAQCIFRGRIPLWGGRAEKFSPNDGHMVLYFGDRVEEFRAAFSELGACFVNPSPKPFAAIAEEQLAVNGESQ